MQISSGPKRIESNMDLPVAATSASTSMNNWLNEVGQYQSFSTDAESINGIAVDATVTGLKNLQTHPSESFDEEVAATESVEKNDFPDNEAAGVSMSHAFKELRKQLQSIDHRIKHEEERHEEIQQQIQAETAKLKQLKEEKERLVTKSDCLKLKLDILSSQKQLLDKTYKVMKDTDVPEATKRLDEVVEKRILQELDYKDLKNKTDSVKKSMEETRERMKVKANNALIEFKRLTAILTREVRMKEKEVEEKKKKQRKRQDKIQDKEKREGLLTEVQTPMKIDLHAKGDDVSEDDASASKGKGDNVRVIRVISSRGRQSYSMPEDVFSKKHRYQ